MTWTQEPYPVPSDRERPHSALFMNTYSSELDEAVSSSVEKIYRHHSPVRIAHWLNAICIPILVMSGFQIFNAHQALYRGTARTVTDLYDPSKL